MADPSMSKLKTAIALEKFALKMPAVASRVLASMIYICCEVAPIEISVHIG